jgi:hypothetical protein
MRSYCISIVVLLYFYLGLGKVLYCYPFAVTSALFTALLRRWCFRPSMAGGLPDSARPGANRGNAADVVQRRHAVGQLANAAIAVVLRPALPQSLTVRSTHQPSLIGNDFHWRRVHATVSGGGCRNLAPIDLGQLGSDAAAMSTSPCPAGLGRFSERR